MAFEARYPGRCANGDRIEPGQQVRYDEDRQLVHIDCDDAAPEVARGPVCMSCFMEKPLSGACPNCD